jgi:hypothetical protein
MTPQLRHPDSRQQTGMRVLIMAVIIEKDEEIESCSTT